MEYPLSVHLRDVIEFIIYIYTKAPINNIENDNTPRYYSQLY